MRKNQVKSYPVALLANVLYNGQPMSRKDVIDDVVLRRKLINFKKQTTGVRKPYIVEDPSTGERFRFDSMAEKKYIDTLLKRVSNGAKVEMEHISTIQKIKTEKPSNAKAAAFIAADHIAEKPNYYDKLKVSKLRNGGNIEGDNFKLKLYNLIIATSDFDEEKYFGQDYDYAKSKFNILSIGDIEKKGVNATAILFEQENEYKFIGDPEELTDYPVDKYYNDSDYYEQVKEGAWEQIEAKDLGKAKTDYDIHLEVSQELEEEIIDFIKSISVSSSRAGFLGSTFYAKYPYKDGFIQIRVGDHYFNPSNVVLGKSATRMVLSDMFGSSSEDLGNIYGYLSINIINSEGNNRKGSDFRDEHKYKIANSEYKLVESITYKSNDFVSGESIDYFEASYKNDINEAIGEIEEQIDLAISAGAFEQEDTILYKQGGAIQQPTTQIQNIKEGTTLQGPSHENGGIEVVVNNKPVAEAEGGEIVINAENSKKYCQELSEINQRHGNGRPLNCDEDDRSEFMRQGGKVADGIKAIIGCPAMEQGGKLELPLADLEEETMARGGLINKRMKFPKTYKPQPGKYGSGKNEPEISDYQKNKFIEKMIDEKGIDPNSYTFEEKQYLRQYSGYGGIDVEEFSSVEEAKKAMTEFYTPDAIIRKMWALAYKYGFKDGQSVLEPSVGTGEFLKYVPVQSMATGYEINKYSYSICKILYPQFDFYLQPFENVFIKNRDTIKNKLSDVKKFDLVIGNPPYGEVSGLGMGMGEKQYTNAKNWIEYFILRGLDLTLPNGLLIYIIGTEVANGGIPFLQQGTSKIKEAIAQKADLLDAYRLPNGVFDRTDVLSDILVFKRK